MHFRTLTAALVAFLIALAPTSAFADTYGDDSGDVRTTESNPAPGEVFGVVVEAEACPTVRLEVGADASVTTIDGEQTNSATKPAVEGEASYDVAISEEGDFRLTGYCDATDEVLGVQMVAVGGAGAVGDTEDAAAGGGTTDSGGILPATGSDLTTTLIAGGGLVLLGAGGVLLLRRRKTTTA